MGHWSEKARVAGLCGALLLTTSCGAPLDADVPPADAVVEDSDGLSWWSAAALDAFLDAQVWLGRESGYIALFARDGRIIHAATAGYADIEAERPMRLDTRVRLASMTKPVTAVAAMLLVQDGKLALDDPVSRYIPVATEIRVALPIAPGSNDEVTTVPLAEPLLVRHLLTFTAGIGNDKEQTGVGRLWSERSLYAGSGSLEERVDRILTAPLHEPPGERWRYGWSADVLARVVEVASGERFDRFLTTRIFEPLGMTATSFLPPPDAQSDLATVYTQDENGDLVRVEALYYDAAEWTPGGSGLVSTAGDYMRFALMLWNRGRHGDLQLLTPETVALMTQPHVRSGVLEDWDIEGLGWGLGLAVVVDADATPMVDRNGDFWWSGYYGTTFVVSPETGLVAVVLAQNEPGPHSSPPYVGYVARGIVQYGL